MACRWYQLYWFTVSRLCFLVFRGTSFQQSRIEDACVSSLLSSVANPHPYFDLTHSLLQYVMVFFVPFASKTRSENWFLIPVQPLLRWGVTACAGLNIEFTKNVTTFFCLGFFVKLLKSMYTPQFALAPNPFCRNRPRVRSMMMMMTSKELHLTSPKSLRL